MKKIICFIIYYTGILSFLNYFYKIFVKKGSLTILMYHRVAGSRYSNYDMAVSSENFERQISYLKKNYKIVSLEELCICIRSKELPQEDYIAITIDDGYKDNYINAYSILKKYNVPVTIFLTTGYIGTDHLFWWDKTAGIINMIFEKKTGVNFQGSSCPEKIKNIYKEIFEDKTKSFQKAFDLLCNHLKEVPEEERNMILAELENKVFPEVNTPLSESNILNWDEIVEMSKNGIDFGSHTITHPILTKIGTARAEEEILHSKKEIENRINKKVLHFSYPNGRAEDFNEDIKKIVKDSGYISSSSTIEGGNDPGTDLFALKRMGINNSPIYIFAVRNAAVIKHLKSIFGN